MCEKQLGELHARRRASRATAGVTGLFGPSGAGKTTLVNMIAGLVAPDRGRIALERHGAVRSSHSASTCRRTGAASAMCFRKAGCFRISAVATNLDYGRRMCGARARCGRNAPHRRPARYRPSARAPARQAVRRRAPARRHRPRAADAAAPAAARRAARLARSRRASARSCPISCGCATRPACRWSMSAIRPRELKRIANVVVRLDAGRVTAIGGLEHA